MVGPSGNFGKAEPQGPERGGQTKHQLIHAVVFYGLEPRRQCPRGVAVVEVTLSVYVHRQAARERRASFRVRSELVEWLDEVTRIL